MASAGETIVWLAVRRDHDGNYDLLKMPNGSSYAWDLSEEDADAVIAHVLSQQLKVHGQSYWKLSYPKDGKRAFLAARNIRI